MKIVVTTPTGNIGSKLAPILLDRGAEITVIARHPEKVKHLSARGAKVVEGDHSDAKVVEKAVKGADALFVLVPPSFTSHDPIGDYVRFAGAAATVITKTPQVHLVLLSSVGANRPEGTGLIRGLHEAENRVRAATQNCTVLRANYFMENALSNLPTIVKDAKIYSVVSGSASLPQVATADIASAAADVLLAHKPGQRIVDVVGPEDLTFEQTAQTIGEGIGNPVQHVTVPTEALTPALTQEGFSPEVVREFIEMESAINTGLGHELHGDERHVGKITLRQFVRDVFVPAYRQAKRGAAA